MAILVALDGPVQAGDEDAYQILLNEIGPLLYSYVRKRVFNKDMVDDVYQEVLFTFHRARHTYQTDRPFGPWLFTVARNAFLDAIGKNRKFAEREVPMENLPEKGHLSVLDGSLGDELTHALEELPESLRRPVELLKLDGLSLEDTAKVMGLSVGRSRSGRIGVTAGCGRYFWKGGGRKHEKEPYALPKR